MTQTAFSAAGAEPLELDTRGLNCPLPILKLKKVLAGQAAGARVRLLATDPGSLKDVEAFCAQTGNVLEEAAASGGEFRFIVRKA